MSKILLLHGALGAASQLSPLAAALKERFEVHTWNFGGHGGRAIPSEPFSIPLFAKELVAHIREKGLEGVDVFGYSMGGYVALYAATHYPGSVGRIFTLATKFSWNPEIAAREAAMLNPSRLEEKVPAFARALMERHAPADWKVLLEKTAEMMREMGNDNPLREADYSSLVNPVLLALGDRDKMVTAEETLEVYRKLKNGSMLMLPDTAHPVESVSVERLSKEISEFLK
jgi:pimeloyl-ACP methyl ester carboxylesterase